MRRIRTFRPFRPAPIHAGNWMELAITARRPLEVTMTTPESRATQRYLRTPDAALILGLSARTLEKHRCYGTGPVFHKLGGRVVYALDDLQSWAEQGVRRSTSDPGNGVVHPAKRLDPAVPGAAGPVRR